MIKTPDQLSSSITEARRNSRVSTVLALGASALTGILSIITEVSTQLSTEVKNTAAVAIGVGVMTVVGETIGAIVQGNRANCLEAVQVQLELGNTSLAPVDTQVQQAAE